MARILLADDDRATLDLVRRGLEMDGHAVTAAEDGTAALRALQMAGPFDALVSDVEMPGLDGIALARAALAVNPGLRLVMMSGYPEVLARATALGVSGLRVLAKPFAIDRIRAEVRAALAG